MAKITIDGKEWEFEAGMNLFEACTVARGGVTLPHFCYHPGLPVAGVCRMCQVEIEGVPKPVIACNARVQDGMVVRTDTERINELVRQILEFHLLHHPVDCPVCDQAGECGLQDQYMNYGLYEADEDIEDKIAKAKVKPIGELVMLDAERCVLCARCTRFTSDVTKTHELGIFNRGNHSEIDVAPGQTLDNNYSLNTVEICPVGALTSRDFRFRKRVWWLSSTDSICPGCATGCNMIIDHDEGTAYRFRARENRAVNDFWMCDEGRLLYKRIGSEDRLAHPLLRDADGVLGEVGWDHAYRGLLSCIEGLGENPGLVFVSSPHATLEEQHAFKAVLGDAAEGRCLGARLQGSEMGEADDLLVAADRTPNAEGARRLGLREFTLAQLKEAGSPQTLLVIHANDLVGLDGGAIDAMSSYGAVLYIGARRDATAEQAAVVLPGLSFAEKDGSFVNGGGRVQAIHKAFEGPAQARDDLRIVRELGELMEHVPAWATVEELRSDLVARISGFGALASGIPAQGLVLDGTAAQTEGVQRG